jgi:4-amino-4-deoxy-L-arabinose transferase-like glycosyltransferase
MPIAERARRSLSALFVAARGWARFPFTLWVATRAALMLFSEMALRLEPHGHREPPWHEAFLRPYPWLDGLCRWDCGWYLRIATHGYESYEESNIWPVYPVLTRIFHEVTRLDLILSLVIVANLACLASWLLMYRLFARLEGEDAARWGLGLYAAYPFAFFQAEAYAESTMVLFSVLAISLALGKKPLGAGLALGLGTLARPFVMIGGVALLIVQIRERGWKRLFTERAVLGLFLPWQILLVYPLWLGHTLHDPFAFWKSRSPGWGEVAWMGVWVPLFARSTDARYWIYPLISLIPAAGTVLLAKEKRWELFAMATILLAVCWGIGAEALGRYSAGCWPAFLSLGVLLARRRSLQVPVLLSLALLQGLFFYLFIEQYPIV